MTNQRLSIILLYYRENRFLSVVALLPKTFDLVAFLKSMPNYVIKLMQSRVYVIGRQKYLFKKNNTDIIFLNWHALSRKPDKWRISRDCISF